MNYVNILFKEKYTITCTRVTRHVVLKIMNEYLTHQILIILVKKIIFHKITLIF